MRSLECIKSLTFLTILFTALMASCHKQRSICTDNEHKISEAIKKWTQIIINLLNLTECSLCTASTRVGPLHSIISAKNELLFGTNDFFKKIIPNIYLAILKLYANTCISIKAGFFTLVYFVISCNNNWYFIIL